MIKEQHITDSYSMNKEIYKDNPRYLNDTLIYNSIVDLLKKGGFNSSNHICQKIKNNTRFQMFGVDIMLDEQLHPYILEMNKGPDMKPKDDEDYQVKKVIEDTFGKVDLIDVDDNQYRDKLETGFLYINLRTSPFLLCPESNIKWLVFFLTFIPIIKIVRMVIPKLSRTYLKIFMRTCFIPKYLIF